MKAKQKGPSMISSDEEVKGQPELKCCKANQVLVVEIWQPGVMLLMYLMKQRIEDLGKFENLVE